MRGGRDQHYRAGAQKRGYDVAGWACAPWPTSAKKRCRKPESARSGTMNEAGPHGQQRLR